MDMILILYVNNLLLLGEDLSKIEDVKCQLGKLYQMKDLGPASSYLGIQISRDQNTWAIWINQQVYIENALKRFELLDANNTNTPLPAGIYLTPVGVPELWFPQQLLDQAIVILPGNYNLSIMTLPGNYDPSGYTLAKCSFLEIN